eukprot:GFUD01003471.1.p1 GENE.GFUD01003471.1~~GFUD01003471.1.p1  ORF type:complete len:488 (-),score=64.25 GFUD01003471.1:20-1483(-)
MTPLQLLLLVMMSSSMSAELGEIDSVEFSNLTLSLHFENDISFVAQLEDEGDCIYEGKVAKDPRSNVLVTGCKQDSVSVQIHSQTAGDHIFSLVNGTIAYPDLSEPEHYPEYYYLDEDDPELFGAVALSNGRLKRDAAYDDYDYDYDDEPLENPEFEADYPDISDAEVGDLTLPKKLILNVNVYLDTNWYKLGRSAAAESKARRVMKQAALLLKHHSLDVKIDLVYGDRIYKSTAPHLIAHKTGLAELNSHLKPPFKMDGGKAVVHLHLTADFNKRSPLLGKATYASLCNKGNPMAIAKFSKTESRTAMTVAHELGHVLGMHHDFKILEGKRETCGGGRGKGVVVMNYGGNRIEWSDCSNVDFKTFYSRTVVAHETFCLKDPNDEVCACNGRVDLAGGECTTEGIQGKWCYVDNPSPCSDVTSLFKDHLSHEACNSKIGPASCSSDQFQCKSGDCIPKTNKCDGLNRECPDGDDEIGCDFEYDYFDL